jgi:outer membrane protein TolC
MAVALVTCAGGATPATAQGDRLTLGDALRLSLEHHPRLAAMQAGRVSAAAALAETKADRIPQAALEATATQFAEPMLVAPLHSIDIAAEPPEFNRTLIQSRLSVGYLLYDGGRRGAGIGQAQALNESAGAAVASARMSVLEEVTRAYLQVLTAAGVGEANRRRAASLEAERGRVEQLLTEGRAARVELLRVDAALASARADLVASDAEVTVASRTLARVIGAAPEAADPSRLTGVIATPVPLAEDPLPDALIANPDMEQIRQRGNAFREAERVARAAWLPAVHLTGGVQTFGSADGRFSTEWQGGIVVSYPLFTGGSRTNGIARASAATTQAEEELRLMEWQVQESVDRAMASYREGQARVPALSTAVEHLEEVARIEQLALATGTGVQTDYLSAEAELVRARAELVRARHAEIAARVALARATGQLTMAWLTEYLENES